MKNFRTGVVATAFLIAGIVAIVAVNRSHAAAAPTTAPATQPSAAVNKTCPVSGDPIDPAITTVYDGKTYAFCCSDCVKAFNKNPAKYAKDAK